MSEETDIEAKEKKIGSTEKMIRNILVSSIIKKAEKHEQLHENVQLRFYPFFDGVEVNCRYDLLIDFIRKEELGFVDISGPLRYTLRQFVEPYIQNLYITINQKENIEINDIRIIIKCTKQDATYKDLEAFLYNKGRSVRKLCVSEFVKKEEEE